MMDVAEATEVLKIMATADHDCGYCGADQWDLFLAKFPQFKPIAAAIVVKELGPRWAEQFGAKE